MGRMTVVAAVLLMLGGLASWPAHAGGPHAGTSPMDPSKRPRAREAGLVIGTLPTGLLNAITDVDGVAVGQVTLDGDDSVRTGVTAILPHEGDLFHDRVPAAIHVANGFGKLLGVTQVSELGELETPILLTGTLGVWRAADAMVGWLLARPGMQQVGSINPVVGETNDGYLNNIRARPLAAGHVIQALESASTGMPDEGAVGAGAGTVAFGWKGGIGTSSREVDAAGGRYTVGVLVQSNYGGDLVVAGVPVGRQLPDPASCLDTGNEPPVADGDGSIMIVVATDAPLDPRQLRRLAARAVIGLGRTGAAMSNGSGDYVIAFSTARQSRRPPDATVLAPATLSNDAVSPLFAAVAEATEEAILNSLFRATTTRGHRGTVPALPIDQVLPLVRARAGM